MHQENCDIYRNFWFNASKPMFIVDVAHTKIDANRSLLNLLEIPEKTINIYTLNDLFGQKVANEIKMHHVSLDANSTITFEIDTDTSQKIKITSEASKNQIFCTIESSIETTAIKKETKEYFRREAQRIARIGYYLLDIKNNKWISCNILDGIFGIDEHYKRNIEAWTKIIHPDYKQEMLNYFFNDVIANKGFFDRKYKIVQVNTGNVRWVHGRGELKFDENKQVVQMIGTIQDITKQKRVEEEIKRTKQLYMDLVETSQDLVWQCNKEGEYIFVNKACETVFGYKAEEMVGRKFTDFQNEEAAQRDNKLFYKLLKGGLIKGYETVHIDKYGNNVYLSFNAKTVLDKKGNIIGTRGTAYDITDRKLAEKAVVEKSNELNKFFSAALDLLCVADINGYFRRLNPQWKEVLGYEVEELEGKKFIDFVHPEDVLSTREAFSKLVNHNTVWKFINRYKCKNGTYKYIEWNSSAYGNMIYAAARDITERILNEETLMKINNELKELNAQKDRFFSIVAHDLKSPLASITGLTDILIDQRDELSEEDIVELLDMLESSSRKLNNLLDNLLNWARAQSGRLQVNIRKLHLFNIVDLITELLLQMASNKKIKLNVDVNRNIHVFADEYMLQTILRNLISNAIKFSYSGSNIDVSAKINNKNVEVIVEDTGVGIAPEDIPKLFKIDTNFSNLGTEKEAGTGLGLILCQEFTDKLNGKIWVESELGKGSRFVFTLPVVQYV